jgi:hypothetical protein
MTIPNFTAWKRDNPQEASRLKVYVQALAKNEHPALPAVGTQLGQRFRMFSEWAFVQNPPSPPPISTPTSPFGARGVFTASDPLSALKLRGYVSDVAVQAEGSYGPDDPRAGQPWANPDIVGQLKDAGFTVHVWEAISQEGQPALDRLGADGGWIGQGESLTQIRDTATVGSRVHARRGVVVNPSELPGDTMAWDRELPGFWPLVECYWQTDDQRRTNYPEVIHFEAYKRGARNIIMVFGLYPSDSPATLGETVPLARYLDHLRGLPSVAGWWAYLAETLVESPSDMATLRALPRVG